MNQRIRQLAEQCRFEIQGINCEVLDQGFDEEKFAQLIVQECAKVILETPVDYMETDTMHRIRDRVKQHFGVEE
jgi:hypothetical protein